MSSILLQLLERGGMALVSISSDITMDTEIPGDMGEESQVAPGLAVSSLLLLTQAWTCVAHSWP
jgi:hypothetical protein